MHYFNFMDGSSFSVNDTTFTFGHQKKEKSTFGKETVSNIDHSSNVHLSGTTVQGKINAAGNVIAIEALVGEINAGGKATLNTTTCDGRIFVGGSIVTNYSQLVAANAGGSITAISSKILDMLNAGGSITATRCRQLGSVRAGGFADLVECPDVYSVFAGGHITLDHVKVSQNVSTGGNASVKNSKIGGRLSCTSNHLVVENSEIDTIDLRCSGVFSIRTNGVTIMNRGVNVINAGTFQNIVIDGNSDQVFINGVPLSQLKSTLSSLPAGKENEAGLKPQILELRNCTVKNVIFEGGKGEVILFGNSIVLGAISGGKIKAEQKANSTKIAPQ